MKAKILFLIAICIVTTSKAQFHTMKIPHASNKVTETQRLGVTNITIDYSSPSVNNRQVWTAPYVIPKNGEPVAWRAGANMNTTINFSTDVIINGQALSEGKYGFHVIPRGDIYTLIFAHNNNQWGSYYLDTLKDVTLKIDVNATECPFSEKLDYEFLDWKENEVVIGLEWADKRLPFTVAVDLNKTVVESFRSELRGIDTYHWQAWNDAAQWCFSHNTNLEEALNWVNRSIDGGFNGFAANKNVANLSTKARLEKALNKTTEMDKTVSEILSLSLSGRETSDFAHLLIQMGKYDLGIKVCNENLKKNKDNLSMLIRRAVLYYYAENIPQAIKDVEKAKELGPDYIKNRMEVVATEMQKGIYVYPYL